MFICTFVYLQKHVQSIVKYLDGEFSAMAVGYFRENFAWDSWLGFEYVCNLFILSYLSFIYLLLYLIIHLLFYLLTSVCVSRVLYCFSLLLFLIIVPICCHVLLYLFKNLYMNTFRKNIFQSVNKIVEDNTLKYFLEM